MTTTPTPEQVLSCPMRKSDTGAYDAADTATVGDYLITRLRELWREGFSNLYDSPVMVALIRAGFIEGEVDEDGYLDGYDEATANKLVDEAIRSLWPKGATT